MGKRGPKTDNPKKYRMAVKYDEECKNILEAYCKQENVNKMEAAFPYKAKPLPHASICLKGRHGVNQNMIL